ncbi:PAS domain-containing sensor histidine kinase [Malikia sp.]|uniref:PAS domain-containing sensor histidine kinase n=1 Tax=Malikia sp. TaxID=2070706 RepID=UPI002634B9E0|nr:PAS domain-containing sensor histidine kinase [Malikia sp.]MDD2728377.1 PAS domain S-box protein [Malikia sp.]
MLENWRRWWRGLSPMRQSRIATFGPAVSVLVFLAAILAAMVYFQLEEQEREREAVVRDVEYAQLQLRQRLQDRRQQLLAIAQDLVQHRIGEFEFNFQGEILISQYPELSGVSWIGSNAVVMASRVAPDAQETPDHEARNALASAARRSAFEQARHQLMPVFVQGDFGPQGGKSLLLALPLTRRELFYGVLLAEFSYEELLRQAVPQQTLARYAVALIDEHGSLLAGVRQDAARSTLRRLPWAMKPPAHRVMLAPEAASLSLQAQAYRTSQDGTGRALFWTLGALSLLTVWMLLANWRHTRRRIQAQQALLSETNFRRAMEDSMLTGMRALDLKGRITYVNPAFCRMTGWDEQDLVNTEPPYPYWPAEDHEAMWKILHEELNGHYSPRGFEMRLQRKDGSLFHGRMYISPLIAPDGHQTGWMTSITDITEPKRVREELGASYERFATVLDSLDTAISVTPLGSVELLFANKMYRTWLGPRGDGHRQLLDLACLAPRPPEAETDDTPSTSAMGSSAEVWLPELEKWLEVRTRYLTWVDGRMAQMVIASDITARRHTEELGAQQAERAQTASRLITMGEMASSVAHELNQPLTAINNYCSGMISRLRRQQISEEDLLGALEKTMKQAQRAGQIIQRIRAFVKRSEPNVTPSDVAQMVGDATELAELELRRHQIRLNTQLAAGLPALMVDPILIEQVLINLIKNGGESIQQAQRPPAQRQVELRVSQRLVEQNPVVEFCVQDTGQGVPPEMLERIYEAFYSTKAEGMGIGLKLCRSIVEAHHGRLQARNLYNPDGIVGCEFSFWIPVSDLPQGDADTITPTPSVGLIAKE